MLRRKTQHVAFFLCAPLRQIYPVLAIARTCKCNCTYMYVQLHVHVCANYIPLLPARRDCVVGLKGCALTRSQSCLCPLVVEPSVDVFQLHQDHEPRSVVAATRDEAFAMGVHHHEHAASLVGMLCSCFQNARPLLCFTSLITKVLSMEPRLSISPSFERMNSW